ncbi:MAG TPA: MFS transporter [Acidimicrobiia bacterium]|nr:MFS transporter [Acidimicrobiia bacterium]
MTDPPMAPSSHAGAPPPIRRRLTGVLFAGVGVSRTGYIAAVTVTVLVAEDMLGSATFAGFPGAVAVLGSALGGSRLAVLMDRHGRRQGMVAGYSLMVAGAIAAAIATALGAFVLLVLALAVFGFGSSVDNLARYAAADAHPAERRGSAIALIVWAGTIGSVLGPALLAPSEGLGRLLGIEELAGGYLLAALGGAAGLMIVASLLRPDPLQFAERGDPARPAVKRVPWSPTVRIAISALAIAQLVMVLIMVMTPVHVRDHGHGLATVGVIISAHTLGMFAISPLTGMLADKVGRLPVILVGQGVLAASAILASVADEQETAVLAVALFLLGLGWNFAFVAGSALLTEGAEPSRRVRLQGLGDAVVWSSGAVASLSSGLLLAASNYAVLCLVGAVLTVVPVMVMVRNRMVPEPIG